MKLSDFILLTEEEKKMLLLHKGVLVAKRRDCNYIVFLFQLDAFYVEMYGRPEDKVVQEYRAFEGTWMLHPYLESIPIDGLL